MVQHNTIGGIKIDPTTILFLFLGVALAIYIIVMIEAATDKGLIKQALKNYKDNSKTKKGEEEAAKKETTPGWPPPEEEHS